MTVTETRSKWASSISSPDLAIICKNVHISKFMEHSSIYINMMGTYINGCAGKEQIIHVAMFLVMLYNACFMYQKDKKSNLLISGLDTFDLGTSVDHEKFMNTLSECNH
jgi:hypothetical protein